MVAPSESTTSLALVQSVESDIRDIRKKMKQMNHFLHKLDSEGGRRLEIVDRDIVQLRKEFSHSITQTEQAMTGLLADLEIKFEKLELKVAKLESSAFTGSSSHHGGHAKWPKSSLEFCFLVSLSLVVHNMYLAV